MAASAAAATTAQADPWNRRTFRLGANGNTQREQSNRSLYLNGKVSATFGSIYSPIVNPRFN